MSNAYSTPPRQRVPQKGGGQMGGQLQQGPPNGRPMPPRGSWGGGGMQRPPMGPITGGPGGPGGMQPMPYPRNGGFPGAGRPGMPGQMQPMPGQGGMMPGGGMQGGGQVNPQIMQQLMQLLMQRMGGGGQMR